MGAMMKQECLPEMATLGQDLVTCGAPVCIVERYSVSPPYLDGVLAYGARERILHTEEDHNDRDGNTRIQSSG